MRTWFAAVLGCSFGSRCHFFMFSVTAFMFSVYMINSSTLNRSTENKESQDQDIKKTTSQNGLYWILKGIDDTFIT